MWAEATITVTTCYSFLNVISPFFLLHHHCLVPSASVIVQEHWAQYWSRYSDRCLCADDRFKTVQIPQIAAQSTTGSTVTLYRLGDHVDISRGPLISTTQQLGRFSVTAVSCLAVYFSCVEFLLCLLHITVFCCWRSVARRNLAPWHFITRFYFTDDLSCKSE